MEVITIRPENNEQSEAIKAVLKALKIPFEDKESPYDSEFVKKVYGAEKDSQGAKTLKSDKDIDDYFNNLGNDVQD